MPQSKLDQQTAYELIRRLVTEYGAKHWKRYAIAFALMAIGAGATALTAYLMGTIVNKAYVDRSFPAIVTIGIITILICSARGAATYGQAVILSRIGTFWYFFHFIVLLPLLSWIETPKPLPASISQPVLTPAE